MRCITKPQTDGARNSASSAKFDCLHFFLFIVPRPNVFRAVETIARVLCNSGPPKIKLPARIITKGVTGTEVAPPIHSVRFQVMVRKANKESHIIHRFARWRHSAFCRVGDQQRDSSTCSTCAIQVFHR